MSEPRPVVVGAGVAGCVAARTLADAGCDVLLLEAGPGPPRPASLDSLDHLDAAVAVDWWYPDAPRRGRGLGGSSAINGMVLDAIHPIDIKRWGWEDALDHQRWLLERWPQTQVEPGPFSRVFGERVRSGFPTSPSTVTSGWTGWGRLTLSAAGGRRASAADVFLPPDLRTAGSVEIRTEAPVRRIAGDERRRVVELHSGELVDASVVFLAAGAIGSPGLLADSDLIDPARVETPLNHSSTAIVVELADELRAAEGAPPSSHLLRTVTGLSENTVDLQMLVLDHTGTDEAGRRHGAVIVSALEPDRQKVLIAGLNQALHWLHSIDGVVKVSISDDNAPVEHRSSSLPPAFAGRGAGSVPGVVVVDASTLPALPHTNPMLSVAIGARRAVLGHIGPA